ncbi:uncharacterized protein GLRG_05607 [Colletotrichum graminicola M1.001]|uniref:Uncharacterized protein n=1 Tax=Colletotrichum graminicola (strain M1.001 / M2 / FGSC 10212) TaxID=645133 RepID=E3QHX5_COLGM|nr:uncharacterized protein GLRG_05607 [Colletotrichum graminicola M1.001]EFQ30463.1 hypothetical protein GLRG_05607 [Colletotrichum graminicola M1.001]
MHAMGSLASPLKRNASQTFETNHDEQVDRHVAFNLGRNPTGPARFIKKPQPKLFYSETMVRDAMRGELVYTPDLKPMMDSIARDMRSTNQTVGRHLGSNIHYSKMKSILKQGQRAMITLDRYLLSEAFIRTDIWKTNRLQEFFKLVHLYGLEREFRDEYWEKNQLSHPCKIQKLYDSINRPRTHPALDEALADQIANWAKDIMSRSVYVPRADHPIIRSAVAIMNMAEQQPDMLQETPKRVAQIWAAWCLARDKYWAETTYLAVIILERGAKNQMVAKCFRRENIALLNLVDKGYDEEACRRWQNMHGKCHVIPLPELLSRPVVASLLHASSSSLSLQRTFSSASQLQKTARMAKKTGTNLTKVVPPKVRELNLSSKRQLSPIPLSSGQHSPPIRRLSDADFTSRHRTQVDMVRHLQIHSDSRPKKGHNDEVERRPSEYSKKPGHPEADQPRTKKRKTTTTSLNPVSPLRLQREIRHDASPAPSTPIAPATPVGSTTPIAAAVPSPALIPSMAPLDTNPIPMAKMSAPIPVDTMSAPPPMHIDPISQWSNQPVSADDFATLVAMKLRSGPYGLPLTGQPVATKAEYESLEETWAKIEARLDKKLSPLIRQLDSLSSEVKALSDKQTAIEQTIAKHADDQHKSQDKQAAHNETLTKKVETLTQLVDNQQTALKQAVIKMDDQYVAVNKRQTTFERTITDKVDSLSQLVRTFQKDQEELKARVERGQKKRRRFSANDKTADSITCAPLGEVASAARGKCD